MLTSVSHSVYIWFYISYYIWFLVCFHISFTSVREIWFQISFMLLFHLSLHPFWWGGGVSHSFSHLNSNLFTWHLACIFKSVSSLFSPIFTPITFSSVAYSFSHQFTLHPVSRVSHAACRQWRVCVCQCMLQTTASHLSGYSRLHSWDWNGSGNGVVSCFVD